MSQTIRSASHPDSSSQLPHGAPTTIPHPQTGSIATGGGHNAFTHPAGPPASGLGGLFGGGRTNKSKVPRGGTTGLGGVPFGQHPQAGLHSGLDNRFITDRNRFGLTSFRPILSVEERTRFLALLRGCRGCNFQLLQFIFGLQYFPQFANIGFCSGRPTSCGVWILGVNGCWFKVSAAEASLAAQFGGPQPISIPCNGIQTVPGFGPAFGFGRLNRRTFGPGQFPGHRNSFPFGGVHPGGPMGHGFGGNGGGGFHPGTNVANSGNQQGGQGAGSDGREHAASGS